MRLLDSVSPARVVPACALLILDKVSGASSRKVANEAARLYGIRRFGHAGTLDPAATGVLPVALDEATRFLPYLVLEPKVYRVTARLGASTTTGDADGEILERAPIPADVGERLALACRRFEGFISQTPPMYSAVHHAGRRLYEWARRGLEVERPPRLVRIDRLRLEDVTDAGFTLEVSCGAGTYVRTLVEDLARAVGTLAHVTTLVRLAVGSLTRARAVDLSTLASTPPAERSRFLLPVSAALPPGPTFQLEDPELAALVHGRSLDVPAALRLGVGEGPARLHDFEGDFRGLGRVEEGILRVLRLRPSLLATAPRGWADHGDEGVTPVAHE